MASLENLGLHNVTLIGVRCISIEVVARTVDRLTLSGISGFASDHVDGSSGPASSQHISLPCGFDPQLCSMLQRCHFDELPAGLKKYSVLVDRFLGCASPLHHNSGVLSGPVLTVIMAVQIWSANMVSSFACHSTSSRNTQKDMRQFQEHFYSMHAM